MQCFVYGIRKLPRDFTAMMLIFSASCLVFVGGSRTTAAEPTDVPAAPADARFDLSSSWQPGESQRVDIEFEVGGHLTVTNDKKVQQIPMSVAANLSYDETLLLNEQTAERSLRAARHYDQARAVIKVGKSGTTPELPADQRDLIVDLVAGRATIFNPAAALSRDQLDLINVVGNSLALVDMLPAEPVREGESWQASAEAVTALLGLDAVASAQVESTLTDVVGDVAKVTITGVVQGAAEGVATEIELKAKYHFNLSARRITGFNMAVREKRSIGHVGPGVDVVAKLKMQLQAAATPTAWANLEQALPSTEPTPEMTRLVYDAGRSGFRVLHDRRWYVTNEQTKVHVLRYVDRGDLIAQCNLTPLPADNPEKPISLEKYQHEVKHALGKNFGQFTRAAQWKDDAGQMVYRVVVQGQVETLPIEWRYYLLTSTTGQRVAAVFTIEGDLLERFAESDRELIDTLLLQTPTGGKQETAQPTETRTPTASRLKSSAK